MASKTLTFSSLSKADQELARKVLDGQLEFKPPFKGFSQDAATYLVMVLDNTSAAMASQYVAIESGRVDGCDVVPHLTLVK